MANDGQLDRASFEQRALNLDEQELKCLEVLAGGAASYDLPGLEADVTSMIPFRNVFANHFNNVIRPPR
jgi:hypothetical protein